MNKILISADSTCDLSPELVERYNINIVPLHVIFNDVDHKDGVDVIPQDLYDYYEETGNLASTSATSVGEYIDAFKPFIEQGYEIVHINLGSALSAAYNNCVLASKQLPGVYAVDSCNLSTGMGLLVIKAAEMRDEDLMTAKGIAKRLGELTSQSHASFVVDILDYLVAGGRCSSAAALAVNLLKIKPSIEVHNEDGSMTTGKKYRGSYNKAMVKYIEDQLSKNKHIDLDRCFVTHTKMDQETVDLAIQTVKDTLPFKEVLETTAGCTISSHCGPGTLGVLFMTTDKKDKENKKAKTNKKDKEAKKETGKE